MTFQILMVLSSDPLKILPVSFCNDKVRTASVCPVKVLTRLVVAWFQILIVLSLLQLANNPLLIKITKSNQLVTLIFMKTFANSLRMGLNSLYALAILSLPDFHCLILTATDEPSILESGHTPHRLGMSLTMSN